MSAGLPIAKRVSHAMKRAWHDRSALDAWVDDRLSVVREAESPLRELVRERVLHRLLPERRLRVSPFGDAPKAARGLARVLALIPPEDTGGGSRPARLAAELHRRGFAIEWRWCLPIYPWPRLRRPQIDHVDAQHVDDSSVSAVSADLVLVEAPHPRLVRLAMSSERHGPLVYDAIDEWDGALGAGWYEREAESRLIESADVLTASAALLGAELRERSKRPVELLPNAVDPAAFAPSTPADPSLRRGRPTVLYVGALWGEWVDLELVEHLARACPKAEIHLVGPAGSRSLPSGPNLHAHGAVARDRIPAMLAAADVTIVPFVPSRLTAAVSPLKVFEYLAMERPVVSTALPDLEGVPGVTIAPDAERFVREVQGATGRTFPRGEVRRFVEGHTWERRIDRLLELTRSVR